MRLEKITTTNTQKIFKVRIPIGDKEITKLFFADNQQSNEFDINKKYNKNSLSANIKYGSGESIIHGMLSSTVIHNIYNSTNPYYKSAIYKVSKTKRTGTSIDFQNITNHRLSAELINSVQINNSIYALEPYSNIGHCNIDIDTNSWISSSYTAGKLIPRKIETVRYNRDYIEDNLSAEIDSNKCVAEVYNNINYNMLYEMDGNIWNDYESSIILANTLKCKNLYDCIYNMSHDSDWNSIDNKYLKNARMYVDVQKCNDMLYLKYYDIVDYIKNRDNKLNSANSFNLQIPNVEVIDSINRFVNYKAHKTNVFSIVIETDIFNKIKNENKHQEYTDVIINNIKLQIKNCINMMIQKLIPVNSQLLNIYFIDK